MVNTRIARFIMEVAPPQFISVMRHRATKMLETISEEEKDAGPNESCSLLSPRAKTTSSNPPTPSAARDASEGNPAAFKGGREGT
ncbi:hypothetical protein MLD38_039301 [Melastoma candidum]|uniref:Uncharacterized protein n=1 Tax=Melastoma candidum TaxID=119954 RepID=A0ACB9L1M4_9MYRT|nr:hypothetical protein MLD38_039301 [Melastoma candidum]